MTDITDKTKVMLGLGLLVMGVLGFLMCLVEIYEVARQRNIHPFRYFSVSHAVIHGAAQLIVVSGFIGTQLILEKWVDAYMVGYAALSLQFCSLYSSLTMSVNRVISVAIPTLYSTIFTPRNTMFIICITWIFSFTSCSVFLIDGCGFALIYSNAEFAFSKEKCGQIFDKYIDIIYNIVLVVVVIPIDVTSAILLQKIAKKRAECTRHLRKEKPWFIQTFLNNFVFALMLICYHMARFSTDQLLRFVLTTAAWEMWLMSSQIFALIILKESRRPYLEVICCLRAVTKKTVPFNSTKAGLYSTYPAELDFLSRGRGNKPVNPLKSLEFTLSSRSNANASKYEECTM